MDASGGVTFDLQSDLTFKIDSAFDDFHEYLYRTRVVEQCNGKIIITTKPKSPVLNPCFDNGFIGTVYHAYNNHRHLILRPDDIWMAISTSLSLFVNAHAEEMRKEFVEHEGKIELEVHGGGSIYTANWNQLIDDMVVQVDKNTKSATREWLVPDFSTTTGEIATAGKVAIMAIFQKYFSYKMCLLCGIPKVTLKGTLEDWQKLQQKVKKLGGLNQAALEHWSRLLEYVVGKLVDSYSGKVDKEFWSKICHIEGWGSGPRYFAGWLNVFMPFDENGKYVLDKANPSKEEWCQINTNDVPPSFVEVPVKIDDNGTEHNTKFIAGFLATAYDKGSNTVSPSIDWAILDLPNENDTKKTRRDWEMVWKNFQKGLYFTGTRL